MRDHRESAEFIGSVPHKIPEGAQDFDGMFGRMDDESRQNFAQWMQLKIEAGHHAEPAGAAAQSPKKIRVFLRGRAHKSTVRQHHVGAADIVAGETVFAHQPSRAAAERESAHSGARNQASGGREPLGRGCRIHIAPYRAPLNCRNPRFAIKRDVAQP